MKTHFVNKEMVFPETEICQRLLKAKANRRVRMFNLQLANDCVLVGTSLTTVHARAQEMALLIYIVGERTDHL